MLSSALTAVLCAVILVSDPLDASAVLSDPQVHVSVGTHVTPTSFRARNFSTIDHLLVFTADGASEPVFVPLPPGGIVEYEFAPEALPGVNLEILALTSPAWTTAGSRPLELPAGAPDMCLWTVPGQPYLTTWLQNGVEATLLKPTQSLLPPDPDKPGMETLTAPTHSPVAVPRTVIGPGEVQYQPM